MNKFSINDNTQNGRRGISTGFVEIDKAVGGFMPGELIVIASLPGKGKSALALSMLRHIALEKKIAAGFISLKMNAEKFNKRFLAQEARISIDELSRPLILTSDISRLKKAKEKMSKAPICLIDKSAISITEIYSEILRMVQENRVKIVFIDIYSSVKGITTFESWPEQASDITVYIKYMSIEFDIPIVGFLKMNRSGDPFENAYLMTSADIFIVLHMGIDGDNTEAALSVSKHWMPLGIFKLRFLKKFLMFEDKE